ncbi:Rubrerythrin Rbr [Desulfosarcina cetonica]|uniref:ferritin-like domain-containing protein n=1 Tax=Desulfosarcina cetonica TaxID=90730 RepID=UPI0006D29BA2|nr:ferritin family protein [Desulfosarcina cetonica]VTR66573.1 Rubrerythrin Rbr [Desulfosarcina cetonica]
MGFENLQAIITFAIEKEREAASFYEENSTAEQMAGKKEMLLEFAAEERKHQKMLEDYLATGVAAKLDDYAFKWIADIKRSDYVEPMAYTPGMAYNELLMLAMKREEASLRLYNDLLAKAEDDGAKKLFKMLCQEEAKHKLALETMYDDYMAEMGD